MGLADAGEQVAGAASDVADTVADDVSANGFDTGFGIVAAFVNAGMVLVEIFVFLVAEEGRALAERGEFLDMLAPDQAGGVAKQRRVVKEGG